MAQTTEPQIQSQNQAQPAVIAQPITGVVPPSVAEAMIREVRPTLLGIQGAGAALASRLVRTVFLAPVGLMLQGPLFVRSSRRSSRSATR